jgi:hypothetical protein
MYDFQSYGIVNVIQINYHMNIQIPNHKGHQLEYGLQLSMNTVLTSTKLKLHPKFIAAIPMPQKSQINNKTLEICIFLVECNTSYSTSAIPEASSDLLAGTNSMKHNP